MSVVASSTDSSGVIPGTAKRKGKVRSSMQYLVAVLTIEKVQSSKPKAQSAQVPSIPLATHLVCLSALHASAISRILRLEVLLAKIHPRLALPSRKPKRSRLILMDSMIASMMRSAEETASALRRKGSQCKLAIVFRGICVIFFGNWRSRSRISLPIYHGTD